MDTIWANRLIAGTKEWSDVPTTRKESVKAELKRRIEIGKITADQYEKITGNTCVRGN